MESEQLLELKRFQCQSVSSPLSPYVWIRSNQWILHLDQKVVWLESFWAKFSALSSLCSVQQRGPCRECVMVRWSFACSLCMLQQQSELPSHPRHCPSTSGTLAVQDAEICVHIRVLILQVLSTWADPCPSAEIHWRLWSSACVDQFSGPSSVGRERT